mgnify:CR=1 FL=1
MLNDAFRAVRNLGLQINRHFKEMERQAEIEQAAGTQRYVDKLVQDCRDAVSQGDTIINDVLVKGEDVLQRLDDLGVAFVGKTEHGFGHEYVTGPMVVSRPTAVTRSWGESSLGLNKGTTPTFRVPSKMEPESVPGIIRTMNTLADRVEELRNSNDIESLVENKVLGKLIDIKYKDPEAYEAAIRNRTVPAHRDESVIAATGFEGRPYKLPDGSDVDPQKIFEQYLDKRSAELKGTPALTS